MTEADVTETTKLRSIEQNAFTGYSHWSFDKKARWKYWSTWRENVCRWPTTGTTSTYTSCRRWLTSGRVGSGRARLAHPDNEVMFFLSPTNTTLTARQAGKQQQDETWQNVTTNVCLRLTATVPHNELFKVLLLKILISLCWNESSHRGVIWATFVQTDGGGKLLFGIFCTFFKHVCKMINIKKKHTDSPPVRDFVKTQFLF